MPRTRFSEVEMYADLGGTPSSPTTKSETYYYDVADSGRVIETRDGDTGDLLQSNAVGSFPAFWKADAQAPGGESLYYVHEDGAGQIAYLTDSSGNLKERRFVDAFGQRTYERIDVATNDPSHASILDHSGVSELFAAEALTPFVSQYTLICCATGNSLVQFDISDWWDDAVKLAGEMWEGLKEDPWGAVKAGAKSLIDFVPILGDSKTLSDPDASWWEKALAGASMGVDVFTLGGATILKQGGKFIIKQGGKIAITVLSEEAAEQAAKALMKEGAERLSKEAVEKLAKEAAEKIAKEEAERLQKEVMEKAAKEAAELAAKEAAAKAASIWKKLPMKRGIAAEDAIEQAGLRAGRLPKNFPGVDFFDRATGTVTSVKSIDLGAETYKDSKNLLAKLKGDIDKLKEFAEADFATVKITSADIKIRQLDVVVPAGSLTEAQRSAITEAAAYAVEKGIDLTAFTVD